MVNYNCRNLIYFSWQLCHFCSFILINDALLLGAYMFRIFMSFNEVVEARCTQ